MAFKLYSDAQVDQPVLACDVCGQQIFDIWNDKATASPSNNGQVTDVTVHHAACVPPVGSVTIPLMNFLRLFAVQARLGDVGSSQGVDTAFVQYPTGKGFETP